MDYTVALSAGFCFGVRRAVERAFALPSGNYVSCGELIHNKAIVQQLLERGIPTVESIDDIPEGVTVILRTHGVGKDTIEKLTARGLGILDLTCPFVKKIHGIAEQEQASGRKNIVIGDAAHPEVFGISKWCENPLIFKDSASVETHFCASSAKNTAYSVVAQTTIERKTWEDCVNLLKKYCTNVKIFDTICNATIERQTEAAEMAKVCPIMIVIGDRKSANTGKLANVCEAKGATVYKIENASQLPKSFPEGIRIGITAGASTPDWIIKEVKKVMSEEMNIPQGGENFAEMLDASFKTLYTGEKVVGIVTAVTPTEVVCDLGTKHAAYLALSQITDDPNAKTSDLVKVGDEIECIVTRVNDIEGTASLSKKRLDVAKTMESIEGAVDSREVFEGIVVDTNKGGIIVSVRGVRVFVPMSQTGLPREANGEEMLKKKVSLRITEVDLRRKRVVGSIKSVSFEARREAMEKVWSDIAVGKEYAGVVKQLMPFGAFVDIGGVDGLVHISELSWSRLRHPSEVVNVGDPITVHVLALDDEKKKISLGYRKAEDNPWTKFTSQYNVGDTATVKVLKFMPFGAFAEIMPGVDGLIHISQMADRRITRPSEVLNEGQTVDVKITAIDMDNKKISLSIRALIAPETMIDEPATPQDGPVEDSNDTIVED